MSAAPQALPYLTTLEVAKRLGVTRGRVQQLITAGDLKALNGGTKLWLIEPQEVERYARSRAEALESKAAQLRGKGPKK